MSRFIFVTRSLPGVDHARAVALAGVDAVAALSGSGGRQRARGLAREGPALVLVDASRF